MGIPPLVIVNEFGVLGTMVHMAHHLQPGGMFTGQQRRAARTTGGTGHIALLKIKTILGELIYVWRLKELRISVVQAVPAQIIDEEENNIGLGRCSSHEGKRAKKGDMK